MKTIDWILIAALLGVFVLALRGAGKRKKNGCCGGGGTCSGSCASCAHCCSCGKHPKGKQP